MDPPLGHQDSIISIEYYAKLWHAPPPFVSWAEALSIKRVDEDVSFRQKIGLNLSEDLFFAFHLILGKKSD